MSVKTSNKSPLVGVLGSVRYSVTFSCVERYSLEQVSKYLSCETSTQCLIVKVFGTLEKEGERKKVPGGGIGPGEGDERDRSRSEAGIIPRHM